MDRYNSHRYIIHLFALKLSVIHKVGIYLVSQSKLCVVGMARAITLPSIKIVQSFHE